MAIFEVITESGADYLIDTERGMWEHRGYFMGRIMTMQSANQTESLDLPWVNPEQWDHVDVPVIGYRMYLSNLDVWRISTPVVSVEVIEA